MVKFGLPSTLLTLTLATNDNLMISVINGSAVDFDLMIETGEEELMGIKVGASGVIQWEEGIFGKVSAYVGAVKKDS